MHPSPPFRQVSRQANLAFASERGFGVLALNPGDAHSPLLSHVPFLLAEDGKFVHAHLSRANPILDILAEGERRAVLAVSGPDSYISPDWYETDPGQVPTWNYVAVHLRGHLRLRPEETLRGHLEALSAKFEQRLLPKPLWRIEKVPGRQLQALMGAIRPIELEIEAVDGTWKLNQNKPDVARLAAAGHVEAEGFGMENLLLAELMRSPPETD
ncbi:MAG: FMN-binding negative transcriptional regulator [Gammaproteobacteria bacterium]|nr:FMN-binding negative transcriptional regulator [Gammaproteobacteria bacterium]MYE29602.1 FMN-binding negative transcriptional regulator [Gammaproteobacteria bacterium]MYI01390.1 FMN-binding negative transcriptional regulator [Gammaproteobacteria bacterium]